MPVPRLFEASSDPRDAWTHVVATLLALGGPATRSALIADLAGEALAGDDLQVHERRPVGADGPVADILVREAGGAWALGVLTSLAFGEEGDWGAAALREALGQRAQRAIVVVVTPDRRTPAALGSDPEVRHRSWLRVRDWIQERPERGAAQGTDLLLLREAEYYFTPRVAELYRLEGLMSHVAGPLRPSLATAFFDLNELAPAPLMRTPSGGAGGTIVFPRTGDAKVEIVVDGDGLTLRVAGDQAGPGFAGDSGDWQSLRVAGPDDYTAARGWVQATARDLLPLRR